MSEVSEKLGMGWLPDYPDFRDYTVEQESIAGMLTKVGVSKVEKVTLPAAVDLRAWSTWFMHGTCGRGASRVF